MVVLRIYDDTICQHRTGTSGSQKKHYLVPAFRIFFELYWCSIEQLCRHWMFCQNNKHRVRVRIIKEWQSYSQR